MSRRLQRTYSRTAASDPTGNDGVSAAHNVLGILAIMIRIVLDSTVLGTDVSLTAVWGMGVFPLDSFGA